MTRRLIDDSNEVVFYPVEGSTATLTTSFKAISHSMISEAEFQKFADEAMEEYKKGNIKPIASSAELL